MNRLMNNHIIAKKKKIFWAQTSDFAKEDKWTESVSDVLKAGPPFKETLTNTFRHQLDALTCYLW